MQTAERKPLVTVIDPLKAEPAKLRVAAYARVSTDSLDQRNSYLAQVDHYTKYISQNEDWELVDIYADEGISGIEAKNRDDFNRMLEDCRAGAIDRILVKSISRFARNTKEYIQAVRELLRLGISIYFEKENIDTGKMSSEQIATIYGAFAQMESTSHSSNMRISVRIRMEKGIFLSSSVPYGYRLQGRELEIIPQEAEVVKSIFAAYLAGRGRDDIAKELNRQGVPRNNGQKKWHPYTISYILTNIAYTGDAIWQKTFRDSTIPFPKIKNIGQRPMYLAEENNPAIISKEDFQKVQELIASRNQIKKHRQVSLYGKHIFCGDCGRMCRRKVTNGKAYWVCRQRDGEKTACSIPQIPEKEVTKALLRLCNKLKQGDTLRPLLAQLEELRERELRSNPKINDIDRELARLSEQNLVLVRLRSKGYMEESMYLFQLDEMNLKLRELRKLRRKILASASEDGAIQATRETIDHLENTPRFITEVPPEVFETVVEKIILLSAEQIKVRLRNGLELTETIGRVTE